MTEWRKVKLGDCCEITSSKRIFYNEYVESGVPFYRSKEIIEKAKGDTISTPLYISHARFEEIKKSFGVPQKRDLLLTAVGSLGIPYLINDSNPFYFKDGNLIWFKSFNGDLNSEFLYYWFKTRNAFQMLDKIAIGSAQKALTISSIKQISIEIPARDIQDRIVTVLSRYDALIENYQRQIKLLEEAAQRLYKEWFVDLRFPGHQPTPIINNLPQSWQKKKLAEIIAYEIGGGWGFDDNSNKDTVPAYVIRGTDMEGLQNGSFSGLPFRYHLESNFKSRKLEPCDIIFEVSGGSKTEGVAKTFLIQDSLLNQFNAPVICASFCKLIRLKCSETAYYVYDTLKYWRASGVTTQYDKRSASSIVNYRWKDFLEQQEILIPNDNVLSKYLDSSKQIHSRMSNLAIQIRNLSEARDRLLPKLMSREIKV